MRGYVVAALGLGAVVLAVRCADVDRGLGDPCIRNEDCLSNVCAGQVCVASPPLLDAAPAPDAGVDGAVTDGAVDGTPDVAPPMEAAHPPPHDAGAPPDTGVPHETGPAKDASDAAHLDAVVHDGAGKDGTTLHDAATDGGDHDAGKAKDAGEDAAGDAHPEVG